MAQSLPIPWRFLCLLDTFVGPRTGSAPPMYCINPNNFSGRRLYYLTGEEEECLWCTNSCPLMVTHPNQHGIPDPVYAARNIRRWLETIGHKRERFNTEEPALLVCGQIAWQTYHQLSAEVADVRTVVLPHPAARTWTTLALAQARRVVQYGKSNARLWLDGGSLRTALGSTI